MRRARRCRSPRRTGDAGASSRSVARKPDLPLVLAAEGCAAQRDQHAAGLGAGATRDEVRRGRPGRTVVDADVGRPGADREVGDEGDDRDAALRPARDRLDDLGPSGALSMTPCDPRRAIAEESAAAASASLSSLRWKRARNTAGRSAGQLALEGACGPRSRTAPVPASPGRPGRCGPTAGPATAAGRGRRWPAATSATVAAGPRAARAARGRPWPRSARPGRRSRGSGRGGAERSWAALSGMRRS